jgi:hypothetical protein
MGRLYSAARGRIFTLYANCWRRPYFHKRFALRLPYLAVESCIFIFYIIDIAVYSFILQN